MAGIQAAKRTSDLIPLCHPVGIGGILINFRIDDAWVEVEARVETVDRTGVEMEALTAVSVACLTIYDMCKSVDRAMTLGEITLWEKTGGRSGAYRRQGDEVGEGAMDRAPAAPRSLTDENFTRVVASSSRHVAWRNPPGTSGERIRFVTGRGPGCGAYAR